jgi:phospholipid/cholesterol/gamma-HCH transport system substrate-binding protein
VKKAIRTYTRPFVAIIGLVIIALGVSGYILSNQRLHLPNWVPVIGSDFVEYKATLPTAKSITPGQGQTVNVAGVPVGEISKVDLVDGRAVVTMKIQRKYATIYRDATVLVRPKTGLDDMILELSPGSNRTPELPKDGTGTIPVSQTLANVELDEVLAGLDGDTRAYLQLLLNGAGTALKGNGRQLAASFKRFTPTNRDLAKITNLLSERRTNVARSIHNFRLLSEALAGKDQQLSELVDSSNAVFRSFAAQDAKLRESLDLLPGTLQSAHTNLGKADKLAKALGPTLQNLRPTARALGPSLKQTRPFLKKTTPVIRDQLRPFARDVQPVVKDLRPAARDLASIGPDLTSSFKVLNYAFNELTYDKPGDNNDSYLFWATWLNHAGNTLFGDADAQGPVRHGLVQVSCPGLATLQSLKAANPQLGLLTALLNPPTQACPGIPAANTETNPVAAVAGAVTATATSPSVPRLAAKPTIGKGAR